MFTFHHEQAEAKILNSEWPAVLNTCVKVATRSALKVFQWIVSSIRHIQLCFEVALMKTRALIRFGFETLGPFSRGVQTYSIVNSPCQNVEILLLCALQLIGSGPVEGRGTHSHSNRQNRTEIHYILMFTHNLKHSWE